MTTNDTFSRLRIRPILYWAAVAGCILTGISLFSLPKFETCYNGEMMKLPCYEGSCLYLYTLHIGNTGGEPQPNVAVTLRSDLNISETFPLVAKNFGMSQREINQEELDEYSVLHIGKLDSKQRVDVSFGLQLPANEPAPNWNSILISVKAEKGRVFNASPEVVRWLRLVFITFNIVP